MTHIHVGLGGWSFRYLTLLAGLRLAKQIGVDGYEAIRIPGWGPGLRRQVIGGDWPEDLFGHHLDPVQTAEVRCAIDAIGVPISAYHLWESLEDTPAERICSFAREMGIPILNAALRRAAGRDRAGSRAAQLVDQSASFFAPPSGVPHPHQQDHFFPVFCAHFKGHPIGVLDCESTIQYPSHSGAPAGVF